LTGSRVGERNKVNPCLLTGCSLSLLRKDIYINRANMLSFLADLPEQTPDAVTVYLPPGLTRDEITSTLRLVFKDGAEDIIEATVVSKTGVCLFWGVVKRLIYPPFPIQDNAVFTGYATGPLISILKHDRTIAIVLVRLGAYGLGVCRGEKLIVNKVGTGLIHARHRQGGSSSQRFRRHREKQIEQFLIRVCERVHEYIVPKIKNVDHIVYGGARTTIELLQKQCPVLESLQNRVLPPLLDISDPRQSVLEAAARRIWSSHVVEWDEQD